MQDVGLTQELQKTRTRSTLSVMTVPEMETGQHF